MIFCHYLLNEGIFNVFYLFHDFLCNYDISKSKDNNWTETWKTYSLITVVIMEIIGLSLANRNVTIFTWWSYALLIIWFRAQYNQYFTCLSYPKWLQWDLYSQLFSSLTKTQPFTQTGQINELCVSTYLYGVLNSGVLTV